MRVGWTPAGSNHQHLLLLAIVLACIARTTNSFFSSSRTPSRDILRYYRPGGVRDVCRRTPQSRRSTPLGEPVAPAGDGKGADHRSDEVRGRGRGLTGDNDRIKNVKKSSDHRTLISGPPRLESVPEEELDTIHVFREQLPGRVPRAIECYADRLAVVGGRRYMIGHPCDWAVSICLLKDDSSVEAVQLDSELMEELLPGLQRELEEEDIHLFVTPVTLTLQGEFLDDDDDDDDDDDNDNDDDDFQTDRPNEAARETWGQEGVEFEVLESVDPSFSMDNEQGDTYETGEELRVPTDINVEGVELIASYWHADQEYALVKHLDPVFAIARQTTIGYYLLGAEEAAAVKPKVEQMLLQEVKEVNASDRDREVKEGLGRESLVET